MKRNTAALSGAEFDLLVIGGGVYGSFAAWDAVLRGLNVALLEKGDFAGGTSANSLKIAHGGLRYLQSADIARTRESAREQASYMAIAPHLVRPLDCLIPTEGWWMRSRYAMLCGFALYEAVRPGRQASRKNGSELPSCRILSREKCRAVLGDAAHNGISGGAAWGEGLIENTERFVLSILRSASASGLEAANYVAAKRFIVRDRKVIGVEAEDRLNGDRFEVRARCTLNAAGPWARQLARRLAGGSTEDPPPLVKAIDFVVSRPLFGKYAVGLRSGGRLYFFVPWRE